MNCVIIGDAVHANNLVELDGKQMMKVFDNITDIVRDDMAETMKKAVRCQLLQHVFLCMPTMN